jgi:hypothetical protein
MKGLPEALRWAFFPRRPIPCVRRKAVASSSLRSVGYDARSHVLEVEFEGGAVYRYGGVPAARHKALLAAASLGRYFNRHVRDRYPTERVE